MPIALAANLPVAALVDACGARRLFGHSARAVYHDIVASIRPGSDHAYEHDYPFDPDDIWQLIGGVALVVAVGTGLLFVWLLTLPGLVAVGAAALTGLVTCVLMVDSVLLTGFTPHLYQQLWQRSRLLLDATWATTVALVAGINAIAFYG